MKLLAALMLVLLAPFASSQTVGRFAVSHDGNFHDKDDIGAIAMVEALIWKANAQDSLVHLDHSSHRGANDPEQHADMVTSANRARFLYGIATNKVFDDFLRLRDSVLNLAAQIDASSATDKLTIIQGGPWEVMALAFDWSDPAKHQFVEIISHSNWNDQHQHLPGHRNKAVFDAQYAPGGKWDGVTPPGYTKIDDQNSYAFKSNINNWSWMSQSLETFFVLWRTSESDYAQGDMSDAGMVFCYLTGEEHPTMQDIRDFFGL